MLGISFTCIYCGKKVAGTSFCGGKIKSRICSKRCKDIHREAGTFFIKSRKPKKYKWSASSADALIEKSLETHEPIPGEKLPQWWGEQNKERDTNSDGKMFYRSTAWRKVRYQVLIRDKRQCASCRTTQGIMHVDHILPRSKAPSLALDPANLQVLCEDCNIGKGAWDSTDWKYE